MSDASRERSRARALEAVITHRCAACGWSATGKLGETQPAFAEHARQCPARPRATLGLGQKRRA
jgi:hypothetical protein